MKNHTEYYFNLKNDFTARKSQGNSLDHDLLEIMELIEKNYPQIFLVKLGHSFASMLSFLKKPFDWPSIKKIIEIATFPANGDTLAQDILAERKQLDRSAYEKIFDGKIAVTNQYGASMAVDKSSMNDLFASWSKSFDENSMTRGSADGRPPFYEIFKKGNAIHINRGLGTTGITITLDTSSLDYMTYYFGNNATSKALGTEQEKRQDLAKMISIVKNMMFYWAQQSYYPQYLTAIKSAVSQSQSQQSQSIFSYNPNEIGQTGSGTITSKFDQPQQTMTQVPLKTTDAFQEWFNSFPTGKTSPLAHTELQIYKKNPHEIAINTGANTRGICIERRGNQYVAFNNYIADKELAYDQSKRNNYLSEILNATAQSLQKSQTLEHVGITYPMVDQNNIPVPGYFVVLNPQSKSCSLVIECSNESDVTNRMAKINDLLGNNAPKFIKRRGNRIHIEPSPEAAAQRLGPYVAQNGEIAISFPDKTIKKNITDILGLTETRFSIAGFGSGQEQTLYLETESVIPQLLIDKIIQQIYLTRNYPQNLQYPEFQDTLAAGVKVLTSPDQPLGLKLSICWLLQYISPKLKGSIENILSSKESMFMKTAGDTYNRNNPGRADQVLQAHIDQGSRNPLDVIEKACRFQLPMEPFNSAPTKVPGDSVSRVGTPVVPQIVVQPTQHAFVPTLVVSQNPSEPPKIVPMVVEKKDPSKVTQESKGRDRNEPELTRSRRTQEPGRRDRKEPSERAASSRTAREEIQRIRENQAPQLPPRSRAPIPTPTSMLIEVPTAVPDEALITASRISEQHKLFKPSRTEDKHLAQAIGKAQEATAYYLANYSNKNGLRRAQCYDYIFRSNTASPECIAIAIHSLINEKSGTGYIMSSKGTDLVKELNAKLTPSLKKHLGKVALETVKTMSAKSEEKLTDEQLEQKLIDIENNIIDNASAGKYTLSFSLDDMDILSTKLSK